MLEVYNDATNKIEADRAAEAEFQNAFIKRVSTALIICLGSVYEPNFH